MGIRTPIGSKTVTSHTYKVPLTDNSNVQHVITAFEVENISEDMMEVDVSGVKHIFSSTVQGMWESVQDRPSGQLDLLIGCNMLGLHPSDYEYRGNMNQAINILQ